MAVMCSSILQLAISSNPILNHLWHGNVSAFDPVMMMLDLPLTIHGRVCSLAVVILAE